jgi:periplasmic divalent cation tolerance protein
MSVEKHARLVLTTCGTAAEAGNLARTLVKKRLAACVNVVPGPIQSIYRWKGKLASAREVFLIIKTTSRRLAELERELKQMHSYDVPEFLVIRIDGGSPDYLKWLRDSVKK